MAALLINSVDTNRYSRPAVHRSRTPRETRGSSNPNAKESNVYIYEKEREREGDWFLVSNWQGRSNRPLPVYIMNAPIVSFRAIHLLLPLLLPRLQFRSKPHVLYLARKYSFAVLNSVRYYRLGPDVRRPIESRHLEMQRTDVIWKKTWREREKYPGAWNG